MIDNKLIASLKEILHRKKSNIYYAEVLGVSIEEIEWAREELKKRGITNRNVKFPLSPKESYTEAEVASYISDLEEQVVKKFEEDVKKGTAEATYTLKEEIHTLEELIEKCKIDTEVWEITRYVQNYWGNSDCPRWQVKAFLSRKPNSVTEALLVEKLLKQYKGSYYAIEKKDILINDVYTRPSCLLISLADFHLDKKTIENKSIEEKIALYEDVLNKLLYKAYKTHLIDEIVFVVGNDYMHVDSYHSTTTNLTPQETLTTWYDAYELGFDLMVKSIAKLKQFCNKLNVIHVPSNHGRTKEYYMAHALEVMFRNDSTIVFDRKADNTKVYTYGECFIGMHHGDTVTDKLPLYFASKYYQDWGRCKHKEIVLADKHHRKDWKFSLSQGEVEGIRMFIAPSLSGADKWHKDKNYDLAVRAGIGRVYDKEYGYVTEFEERI